MTQGVCPVCDFYTRTGIDDSDDDDSDDSGGIYRFNVFNVLKPYAKSNCKRNGSFICRYS